MHDPFNDLLENHKVRGIVLKLVCEMQAFAQEHGYACRLERFNRGSYARGSIATLRIAEHEVSVEVSETATSPTAINIGLKWFTGQPGNHSVQWNFAHHDMDGRIVLAATYGDNAVQRVVDQAPETTGTALALLLDALHEAAQAEHAKQRSPTLH
ncbi:hypothetical protein COV06_01525 [Candidatus Uhrbacteria bacterium CG10_big_fil_rev_8_21_14_0_10_50_16]|uniref:Uncharacterized protein n=1 Tax=Candidatus Uhrbacteria bacterium CG10_big_fil_rev_8_21_14_0_10_50_16 TaxID=1975039 RepID=A0A2H0RNC8_9BACT|nr:MAG: hypothetical protein COV06_01525 [Candidatus Uhrbacteria bacterium CG10_big_fil_rev_8_21_14_0_10_50_16]